MAVSSCLPEWWDKRIERVQKLRNLTLETAAKFVRKEDRGRER